MVFIDQRLLGQLAEVQAERDRLRMRVARLEHRALAAVMADDLENQRNYLDELGTELLDVPAIDCPACGAPGDQAHEPGCEVTR